MKKIFTDLNQAVEFENLQRLKEGTLTIPKSEVLLFGQMSLMLNESVVKILNLIQNGDMDAKQLVRKAIASENGNIRFEIFRQDSPSEIVNGKYSVQGDNGGFYET